MKYKLLGIASVALFAVTVFAEDMKPGLWEMTLQDRHVSAMQENLAKLPPAARRQMEDMMANQGAQMDETGMVVKVCITPEMAKLGAISRQHGDCASTTSQRVGNTRKHSHVCATEPPLSIEVELSFQDDTAFSGKMRTVIGGQASDSQTSGRWLNDDCGDVEPMPMPQLPDS